MLRQPAADPRDAAVRWRQLVDLIARAGLAAEPALLDEALAIIRSDAERVAEPLRSAAARAIAALPLPLGLLECFVSDKLTVSAPIIAAAALDSAQWQGVLANADAETRRFIETLHPELALSRPDAAASSPPSAIGELVARIERRRNRAEPLRPPPPPPPSPATPAATASQLFEWEAGTNGEIDWVDGVPRGAVIGRSLAKPSEWRSESIAAEALRAFASRTPFRDCEMTIAGSGPGSGAWLLNGSPAFDPADGRFRGYRGQGRRSTEALSDVPSSEPLPHLPLDADSLRELVHELRTPLNAIIGFSEIIDGQYLGPAGRRYRQRATDIAASARTLLSSIDDLDLAATAECAAGPRPGSDLAAIAARIIPPLAEAAQNRGVQLVFVPSREEAWVQADPALVTRLAERLLGALAALAVSDERLLLSVKASGGLGRLNVSRPAALAESSLNSNDDDFALRITRALARIAGGDVLLEGEHVALVFAELRLGGSANPG